MSGLVKGVKKVFSKVLKVVKKVAPVILAAAAIYFTAGAALGISGAAGGWGAAASSLSSNLGLTGTLGKIVTGAVTQAGYGAAIGGVTSFVTGGDVMKGMQTGAAAGAVTGGITGGIGFETDPLKGAFGDAPVNPLEASGGDPFNTISGQPFDMDTGGVMAGGSGAEASAVDRVLGNLSGGGGMPARGSMPAAGGAGGGAASGGGNGFFAEGGWLERNQGLAGQGILGVGQGLLKGMSANDSNEALLQRHRDIADSYRTGGNGLLLTGPDARTGTAPPMHAGGIERTSPVLQAGPGVTAGGTGRWRYQYDPRRGQIVPVRVG